jgi:hypothetical protein
MSEQTKTSEAGKAPARYRPTELDERLPLAAWRLVSDEARERRRIGVGANELEWAVNQLGAKSLRGIASSPRIGLRRLICAMALSDGADREAFCVCAAARYRDLERAIGLEPEAERRRKRIYAELARRARAGERPSDAEIEGAVGRLGPARLTALAAKGRKVRVNSAAAAAKAGDREVARAYKTLGLLRHSELTELAADGKPTSGSDAAGRRRAASEAIAALGIERVRSALSGRAPWPGPCENEAAGADGEEREQWAKLASARPDEIYALLRPTPIMTAVDGGERAVSRAELGVRIYGALGI